MCSSLDFMLATTIQRLSMTVIIPGNLLILHLYLNKINNFYCRSTDDYDWGISQLDAVMDRKEVTGSHFLVLTNFGDHALHHMFPTLDHAVLDMLYPVFKKVSDSFVKTIGTNDCFLGNESIRYESKNGIPSGDHMGQFPATCQNES